MSLQERYVVLTGDLKSSRTLENREDVQEILKEALSLINERFKREIVAEFMVVRGDEFQGMIATPKSLTDLHYALFETVGHQFYLGVGIGSLSTKVSKNIGEIDGEAFHNASKALEEVKRQDTWIEFRAGWETDGIITWLLNFTAETMWHWTERQREVVNRYKKMKAETDNVTLREVAEELGVTKQTISGIMRRSRYTMVENAGERVASYVSQKWLTMKNKPKSPDRGE